MKIEINEQFAKALKLMKNSKKNLFITGRAGTGKSTLLEYFRDSTQKKTVVLAPTGVAALNVHGQTIHSFFGFPPTISPLQAKTEHPFEKMKSLIKNMDIIIIDEASMLRADLLDSIDEALRQYEDPERPFGGKRVILIGDLYQLPPVLTTEEKEEFNQNYASPYFFDAKVFKEEGVKIIELKKIYRQNEQEFINLLNKIRGNTTTDDDMEVLNQRLNEEYEAFQKPREITLCTTNASANKINAQQLKKIHGKPIKLEGTIIGEFTRQMPTEEKLQLKVGAQVMMVNNDATRRWVNGSVGVISRQEWDEESECSTFTVLLDNGKEEEVLPFTWESNNYYYDHESESIQMECIGSFTQYPMKLAWAVTIHKSQGKTFNNVVVDIGRGTFAHGQIYVALSRCTNFNGLVLRKPIQKKHIWSDYRIAHFMSHGDTLPPALTMNEKMALLETGIECETTFEMTYVKGNGDRIQKSIRPLWVGEMEYKGVSYLGMEAEVNGRNQTYSLKRVMSLEERN
jgi:ATP-dependent DNA helicase PIF1